MVVLFLTRLPIKLKRTVGEYFCGSIASIHMPSLFHHTFWLYVTLLTLDVCNLSLCEHKRHGWYYCPSVSNLLHLLLPTNTPVTTEKVPTNLIWTYYKYCWWWPQKENKIGELTPVDEIMSQTVLAERIRYKPTYVRQFCGGDSFALVVPT